MKKKNLYLYFTKMDLFVILTFTIDIKVTHLSTRNALNSEV